MQQLPQVYFNVARVGAQGLLGGGWAETRGDQILKELLVEAIGKPPEAAADGGFMNAQGLRDLKKGLAIEIVGGEQKAVFCSDRSQRAGDGGCKLGQVGGDWIARCWRGTVEILQRRFAVRSAVVVAESLHKGGAKPSQERAAAGVGCQRRAAFALRLAEPVELGVEGVREVLTECCRARDRHGCLYKRCAVAGQECLPRRIAPLRAGVCESQFGKMERAEECGFLSCAWMVAGREAVVDFLADRSQHTAELLHTEPAGLSLRTAPKLLDNTGRELLSRKLRMFLRCGLLPDRYGQREIGGFGRGRIHVPEDTAFALGTGQDCAGSLSRIGYFRLTEILRPSLSDKFVTSSLRRRCHPCQPTSDSSSCFSSSSAFLGFLPGPVGLVFLACLVFNDSARTRPPASSK